jgi:hypothetical protein
MSCAPLRTALGTAFALALTTLGLGHCSQASLGGSDSDGVSGGDATFALTVTDDAFSPGILKCQNLANVTVTMTNAGTRSHDFAVGCMGSSCFPDAASISPLVPDSSATVRFAAPYAEGIYPFKSDLPGDTQTGQFILQ